MSSLYFDCAVTSSISEAEALFGLLYEACCNRDPKSRSKVIELLQKEDDYELPFMDFSLSKSDAELSLNFEAPPSFDIDFFDDIICALEKIPDIHFKARLFDSSSGGAQIWRKPEQPPMDLEGKRLVFAGEMESDLDEMLEFAEDVAIVQESLDGDTEVLVVGSNVDASILKKAADNNITVYSEEDFLDYFQYSP